jgi:hypothetical protein
VREARDEAKKEIEAYRAKKEAEYKEFEAQVLIFGTPGAGDKLTSTAHTRKQAGRGGSQQGGRRQDQGNPGGGEEEPGEGHQRPAFRRFRRSPYACVMNGDSFGDDGLEMKRGHGLYQSNCSGWIERCTEADEEMAT